MVGPPHLMTLADLSPSQITKIIQHSHWLKQHSKSMLQPYRSNKDHPYRPHRRLPTQTLMGKSIALLFSKRSTRTRLASETSIGLLGGRALFLGKEDIQLGVNETARDSARVIGGMCEGIFARVGDHSEIEELAKYSPVPVINALSSLWHPTQVLADLLTLHEHRDLFSGQLLSAATKMAPSPLSSALHRNFTPFPMNLDPLTIAYVGDSANVLHDMLVTYPRLGHKLRVASPPKPLYRAPEPVWNRVKELGCDKNIWWGDDPKEAVHGADLVVTDTWISMGQEKEKDMRLKDFKGYQVTEQLCKEGGANPNWKFMHCLPRKPHEVDDEVFYGPRSLVFPEADNRKWTTMALFDLMYGKWTLDAPFGKRAQMHPKPKGEEAESNSKVEDTAETAGDHPQEA